MNYRVGLLVLAIAVPGTAFAEDVPVVGLDENNQSVVRNIPSGQYSDSLKTVLFSVQGSMLPLLENGCQKAPRQGSWALRTVTVGVNAGIQGGLGPIISLTGKARFRVVFTNQRNAVYPD